MAARYWVGGSGSWTSASTTNWSATSGGAGGATAPTSTDDVYFDANSAAGNYTVTGTGTLSVGSLNIAKPASGILTFSGTPVVNVNGNLDGSGAGGNVTWSIVGQFNFAGAGSYTVTTGDILFDRFAFNNGSGTWTLQDTVNVKTAFGINTGILNLNEQTVNTPALGNSGVAAKTWNMGTNSVINVTGNATTVVNFITASGMTVTGTGYINLSYSGSTGTRTVNTGLTASGAFNIKVSAGSDTVVLSTYVNDLDFTGFSGTLSPIARTIYGNLTLSGSMTVTPSATGTTFAGTGASKTITTNETFLDLALIFNSTNPVLLNGNLYAPTKAITVTAGGIVTNGYSITTNAISSSNTNVRTIDITNSTVTINSIGSPWNLATSTNLTFVSTGSTIILASAAANAKTFAGGNLTYNNLVIGGLTGTTVTVTTTFTGNNTFTGTLSSTKTVTHNVLFTAGTTNTFGGWTITGTAGNIVYINSTGSPPVATHNLVFTGSGTVNVNYTSISYSNASPANKWYSLLTNNNIDGGNNTGWIFTDVPPVASSSNFFLVF